MKIVRIISEHKQKKTIGLVEAIVRLEDGRMVTRHIQKSMVPKESPKAEEQS